MIDIKSERVWLYLNPTDMRKSFDTLAAEKNKFTTVASMVHIRRKFFEALELGEKLC